MHALSVAYVSMSIESIIESQISTYEALFPKKNRTPCEKPGKQEMIMKLMPGQKHILEIG